MERIYSIHDVLMFKIVGGKLFSPINSLNVEYENFRVEEKKVTPTSLEIYLGSFKPKLSGCYFLDGRYYICEDYFYCEDFYKVIKWKFEMSGFEGWNVKARLHVNILGWSFISGFIVDQLTGYLLNKIGYPLIHGSCVGKNNRAYIFTGQGGSGKTTIALSLVEKGYNFLGDNFIILHNNYALNFLSPLNLFYFNLLPTVKERMKVKSKVEFYFKRLLHKTAGIKIATKINVSDIFPDLIQRKSKLYAIFLLLPRKHFNSFNMERIDKKELIEHLVMNQKIDSTPFFKYMLEYSCVFPGSCMATHWTRYRENLEKAIKDDVLIFRVEMPDDTLKASSKIAKVIENGAILQYS